MLSCTTNRSLRAPLRSALMVNVCYRPDCSQRVNNRGSRMRQIRGTVLAVARDIGALSIETKLPFMAAAIAFFGTLSLAPLLALAISLAGLFVAEAVIEDQLLTTVAENFGPETAVFLDELIETAFRPGGSGPVLALIGLLISVFFATNMFYWLKVALNSVWNVAAKDRPRSGLLAVFWNRLLAAAMVLLTSVVLALTMLNSVLSVQLPQWLAKRWPEFADTAWYYSQNLGLDMLMVTGLMMAAYKLLPDVPLTWRQVLPGALLVTVLFMMGNQVMDLYFSVGMVATAYGAAGSLVMVLLWIYYLSLAFFFGALFTRAFVRHLDW